MKILLCEDNQLELEEAKRCIQEATEDYQTPVKLHCFQEVESCLGYLENNVPDLAFIDIFMGGESGLHIARAIREKSRQAQIVFLTGSNEFAVESYDVEALDYVLKPPTPDRIRRTFEKYLQKYNSVEKFIQVKWRREELKIKESSILYIKTTGNETSFYTDNGVVSVYYPLKEIEKQLSPEWFLRLRKGLITSMDYIETMDTGCCTLKNGEEYSLSRKDKAAIRKKYFDYQFSKIEGR